MTAMDLVFKCNCLSFSNGSYNLRNRERREQEANAAAAGMKQGKPLKKQPLVGEETEGLRQQEQAVVAQDVLGSSSSSNKLNANREISSQPSQSVDIHASIQTGTRETKQTSTRNENPWRGHKKSSSTGVMDHSNQTRLSSFTLEGIAELINENKISKSSVIVLVGAGMSTAAGVPDFRLPDGGIYSQLGKYNLQHPEDVFKLSYFKNNPEPFYDLTRTLLPKKLYPTLSHYFVRLLHEKGYLLRCFSQNVDSLESLSGIPKDKLCLAHGSFETGHCLRCNAEYPLDWMRSVIEIGAIPHCVKTQDCKGLIKPDVKFFGERLDSRFFRSVKNDFPKCELLIIIGSSLTVMPFASLVQKVPSTCPRLLINKTKSGRNLPAILRLFMPSNGLKYDKKSNTRDVAFLGDCDQGTLQLATLLNWREDLEDMAQRKTHELEQSKLNRKLPKDLSNDRDSTE